LNREAVYFKLRNRWEYEEPCGRKKQRSTTYKEWPHLSKPLKYVVHNMKRPVNAVDKEEIVSYYGDKG
jgi:hypothetical protein